MRRPIITLEDGTEVLETTGDIDAFNHGGGVVFIDSRRRDIFWTFWPARDYGERNFTVYTIVIPDNVFKSYKLDLNELEPVSGIKRSELLKMSNSKSYRDRLEVIMAISDCHGPSYLDINKSSEEVTLYEMASRWGDVFATTTDDIPAVELDDFIVREKGDGWYECGRVDGIYFGKFKKYKECMCQIADYMKMTSSFASNLFHEHDHGLLELVSWEPDSFVGKMSKKKVKVSGIRWKNSMNKYIRNEINKKSGNIKSDSIIKFRNRRSDKIKNSRIIAESRK